MSVFSDRLKWLRDKRNLTQADMAEAIGMSRPGYTKIEQGQREPNLETLAKIYYTLNESLDFLLGVIHFDRETELLLDEMALCRKHIEDARELIRRIVSEDMHTDVLKETVLSNEKWITKNIDWFNNAKIRVLLNYNEIPHVPEDLINKIKSSEAE